MSVLEKILSTKQLTPLPFQEKRLVPSNYETLAEELGFLPGALLETQMHNFLIEQQIPIFDKEKVATYMTKLANKHDAIFVWRPLRQKDRDIMGTWGWGQRNQHDNYRYDSSLCANYDQLVPGSVLEDVKTIEGRFKNQVAFFVSDYKAADPDPFILVTSPSGTMKKKIFGAWDEPGFGIV